MLILSGFAIFWYQTLDAIDGKHARNTDNCSPLGQLLDHSLDQFSHVLFVILGLAMARSGSRVWTILMIVNGQLLPQYSIEFRKHFTQFHATVVEVAGGIQMGATECCMIMYGLQFTFAAYPGTNEVAMVEIDFAKLGSPIPLKCYVGDLLAFSTFTLSL